MTLLLTNLQHRFQAMKYSRYSVPSQNVSNEYTLEVEENVVSDIMSPHGVFIMNALVCCGVVGIQSPDVCIYKLTGRYFREK